MLINIAPLQAANLRWPKSKEARESEYQLCINVVNQGANQVFGLLGRVMGRVLWVNGIFG